MCSSSSGSRCAHRPRVEARRRALDADDPDEVAAAVAHGRGDRGKVLLALLPRLGVTTPANPLELLDELSPRRDRARRERRERIGRELDVAEREHHLAGRGRMADARAAELGDALDDGGAVGEVDGDRVVLARGRQRRRLARLPDERLEVRPGELAEVEPPEHGVPELDEPQRQAIAARLRHVLDEAGRGERREQPRDRAGVDRRATCDLVRAELAAVGESVEHRERALDGGDVADSWLTGAGRDTLLYSFLTCHCPGGNSRCYLLRLASSSSAPACTASRPPTTSPSSSASAVTGSGADVIVLEKSDPGAGATGIACGVVRNNYFQPAMSELMQACVEVWESDPEAYHYNGVGYIALGPQVQESDLTAVYERHQRIGYRSDLYLGEAEVDAHMKELFPDWRAQGVTVCLHEHQGGFAFNLESVAGLARQVPRRGRRDPLPHRGDGVRARRRRQRHRRRDRQGPDRRRRAARDRPRPVGEALLGACSGSR